jgi:hypothetical protein
MDVVDNGGKGYHLRDWIAVEVYDEAGTLATGPGRAARPRNGIEEKFNERQRWVLAQLAAGEPLTRRDVEEQFGVHTCTVKRDLAVLTNSGLIEFDRPARCYRMR